MTNAESSPAAAAAAAYQIRKFLSKDNTNRPHVQYNAIMLVRILADNPGASFTQNLDKKFAETVRELLRNSRDPSVQQMLRETLSALYREKAYDNNLSNLFQMWDREQGSHAQPRQSQSRPMNAPAWNDYQQPRNTFARHPSLESYANPNQRQGSGLPPPSELAARIEEARTSAKLLLQLVQSSGPGELLSNELVKEFAERCQSAQRSMQMYINCENPAPDDETMQTLIETSEQLSLATSKHQRAVLSERRAVGAVVSPNQPAVTAFHNGSSAPLESSAAVPRVDPPAPGAAFFTLENRQSNSMYNPPSGPPAGYSQPNGPPTLYTQPRGPPTIYTQPSGPSTTHDHPNRSSTTHDQPFSPSDSSYSPPPGPPPSMQANLQRRTSPIQPVSPVAHIPTEPIELPSPTYANPFSDDNEHHHPPEPRTLPPMSGPPPATAPPPPPPRPQLVDIPPVRRKKVTGSPESPESHHPGFNSTPSYMHRQESAVGNLTMHGAANPDT